MKFYYSAEFSISGLSRSIKSGMLRLMFGLVMLATSLNASAQAPQSIESLIMKLQSTSPEVRTSASRYIYGAGIDNAELYVAVANAIEVKIASLDKDSSSLLQQEVSWHTKALASSGDKDYL